MRCLVLVLLLAACSPPIDGAGGDAPPTFVPDAGETPDAVTGDPCVEHWECYAAGARYLCDNGACDVTPVDAPDAGEVDAGDVAPDAGGLPRLPDGRIDARDVMLDSCEPWSSEQQVCAHLGERMGFECGDVAPPTQCFTGTFRCGCPNSVLCGADGRCKCDLPTTHEERTAVQCAPNGATRRCGTREQRDLCGNAIEPIACGTCPPYEECRDNYCRPACGDVPYWTDAQACSESVKCGTRSVTDRCGNTYDHDCGACPIGAACVTNPQDGRRDCEPL